MASTPVDTTGDKYKPMKDEDCARVLGCETGSVDGDPFGCTKSGYLHLRGQMLLATEWKGTTPPYYAAHWKKHASHFLAHRSQTIATDQLVYVFDIFPPGSDETTVNFGAVYFLQLATFDWSDGERYPMTVVLLLEPAETLGNYRRIGMAQVPNCKGFTSEGWEIKNVTII